MHTFTTSKNLRGESTAWVIYFLFAIKIGLLDTQHQHIILWKTAPVG